MSDLEKGTVNANPLPRQTSAPRRRLGNPGPLGLFGFASTTLVLSLYNVNARHITTPNVVVGLALFYGGLAQFLAGMWEFAVGNTFGATAFTSYGAFWLSFATLFVPGSGIAAAYANNDQEDDALAIYLTVWMVVTILFLIASLRKNVGFIALFSFLTIIFMLLAIGDYTRNLKFAKAGGGFGILTALIAYYCGMCELLSPEDLFVLPLGRFA
ncbi:GPR1/FUN34/yaaH family-domain-containing protein, partial [Amylostereum chailletii]